MTRPGRHRYDDIVDAITAWHPDCRASQVFGMPCVKRSGRVVFGLSRTGMVFKLTDPEAHARALAVPGAHLFDLGGRGDARSSWEPPGFPNPFPWSAVADRRLRRRVVVPPERADEWEPFAAEAVGQDHSIPPPTHVG